MPGKDQSHSIGKRVGKDLYVHRDAIEQIPAKAHDNLNTALEILAREIEGWNILRLSDETVAFLEYENFDDDPFPQLSKSIAVDLVRGKVRETDYSSHSNRPILHRKELMVPLDYPGRGDFKKLTVDLENFGLFYEQNRIGYKNQWTKRLKEHGVVIKGHNAEIITSDKFETIDRHKTALVRYQLSQPVKLLLRHGLLTDGKSFFDYGCGKGSDLNGLQNGGYDANGWDLPEASQVSVLPNLPEVYRKQIENLSGTLNANDACRSEAIPIIRSLIDKIVVHKRPGRGHFDLELFGSLSKIIGLAGGKNANEVDVMTMMVAEEGLEPPTRGL
jgi:hypothetical protein